MLCISKDKIDSLFELIGSSQPLYMPVDNASGKADFKLWEKGDKLSETLKTVRSAKDFFLPKAEHMVSYERNGMEVTVTDPRKDLEDFVVFGVRACDAASFSLIDAVYLNMNPVDTYYKNRRDHGTVVTLACNEPAKTCFCKAYGIDAANPAGDVSAWLAEDAYYFEAITEKGKAFVEKAKSVLADSDAKAVEAVKKEISEKASGTPFANLDLSKIAKMDMLKMFNSKVWDSVYTTCLGCGTCTYVCPTCMCFDVRDFTTKNGIKQYRCYDSCMFNDFTQMAAENPRHTQKERFRQRFMHKLKYYPMAHEDRFSCVGCGRCLESCPINMNVVKVIKAFNESEEN